jgi:hypothetical protein
MSARKVQYGAPDSIFGVGFLPYSPVGTPILGRPVTARDDGSEFKIIHIIANWEVRKGPIILRSGYPGGLFPVDKNVVGIKCAMKCLMVMH